MSPKLRYDQPLDIYGKTVRDLISGTIQNTQKKETDQIQVSLALEKITVRHLEVFCSFVSIITSTKQKNLACNMDCHNYNFLKVCLR
jgi:hypothetical protein